MVVHNVLSKASVLETGTSASQGHTTERLLYLKSTLKSKEASLILRLTAVKGSHPSAFVGAQLHLMLLNVVCAEMTLPYFRCTLFTRKSFRACFDIVKHCACYNRLCTLSETHGPESEASPVVEQPLASLHGIDLSNVLLYTALMEVHESCRNFQTV
ncbi:hypothetical protein PR048_012124 [Dryococelus australis]|uniref:Uncharacterized protein n=1 Tax=Dryococelus australis TaxID=614101 RepID=A0ABQ9HNI9_9NEOP|nr:hypothetical protein PR048_012124 [Dryococelus australis]